MSKDDHKNNSLENIMDAVVSIQGGEVSLKGGPAAAKNHYKGKQDSSGRNHHGGNIPKAPVSNFDSPTKGRMFYNKTQTHEESRGAN